MPTARLRIVGTAAAVLLAIGGAFVPAGAASALIPPEQSGPSCLPGYRDVGGAGRACVAPGTACAAPELTVPAGYVRRSPATRGRQTVALVNTLSRWERPAWVGAEQQRGEFPIPAGRAGRAGMSSDFCLHAPGDYSVVTTLLWYDSASGRLLQVRSRIAEPVGVPE